MLTEAGIDKLIQPVVVRQQNINRYVLSVLAERIEEVGKLLPSDLYTIRRLVKSGSDMRKINTYLSRQTKLQVADIKSIISSVAESAYKDAKLFYAVSNTPQVPFGQNERLQTLIRITALQTVNTYHNLANAQAFMIRDLAHPKLLKATSLSKTYQTVLDEAIQAVQSGVVDYHTAMRRTLEQLVDSGIQYVKYDPESHKTYHQRLDTAVRRNLLDGVRQMNQQAQNLIGEQFGADGVELTAHENPAPDHAPVQGRQFSLEEFEKMQSGEDFTDYEGHHFSGFDRAIGTLNCMHLAYRIILGVAAPVYSDAELNAINKRNEKGYTLPNGKHLTMYECTQYQRKLETDIRRLKDGQQVAEQAGDETLANKYTAKISTKLKIYYQFSKNCGLKPKINRI